MFGLRVSYSLVSSDPPLLEVFAIGAGVLVFVTLVHGSGLARIVRNYRRGARWLLEHASHPFRANLYLGWSVLLMLVLHVIDMCIWAVMLNRMGLVTNLRNSFYFTANSYTTLGFGAVPLGLGWRELSPIMAISGLFTFGWTTSVMFNVVGYHHELVEELADEHARKLQMRRDFESAKDSLDQREEEQEKSAIATERQQEAAKTFFQRFRMRRIEGTKLRAMREEVAQQVAEALKKERDAEGKIYQPPSSTPKS